MKTPRSQRGCRDPREEGKETAEEQKDFGGYGNPKGLQRPLCPLGMCWCLSLPTMGRALGTWWL